MSVTKTFTVTVVSTDSGNKYFIDGVQQATINIAEGGTYKFDQSDSSNSSGTAYTAGGATLTSVTPTTSGTTAFCDFADVSYTSASFTANGALIYNDDQSDKAVAVIAFGGDKTVSSGTFTIQFPTADATNAIIRIA